MTGGFRKPVSASDWWWLAHPARMAPVIQVAVVGAGDLDRATLDAALATTAEAGPGLRLVRRGRRWVDSGHPPVARTGSPHDPLPTGAPCEVLCVDDGLVFRASHAVMDWPGMAMWIGDVFRVLRGAAPAGAPSTVTEQDVFQRVGSGAAGRAAGNPKMDCASPLGEPAQPGRHRTVWARATVDGYHPGVVAKVASALTSAYGLASTRYAVAFDLRRHVPGERSTGNLSQVELFDVAADEGWEALHERLLTAMAEGREVTNRVESPLLRMPLPALRTLIRVMEGGAAQKRRYTSASVLAHLGRFELDQLCAPGFTATTLYPVPLLTAMSPPDVNLVEVGGRTELTLTWRDGPGMRERAEAVLAQVADALSPPAHRTWSGNDTARPASGRTVVERFRTQVSARPDAVAVRWPGGEMSYAVLDRRSDAVARRLADLGVRTGSVVGLLAGRSAEAVAGIWGVLKAGAAYLPLDPRHPPARLAGLLADAGATVCLAQRPHELPGGVVFLDDIPDGDAPAGTPGLDDLAYVIYTSGSTGRPKGVQVEHGALANYVDWAVERYDLGPATRFALITSLAFDLSNTALFAPLAAGGSLVLVPDEPNHVTLREMLTGSGADTLSLTPSHLDLIGRLDLRPTGFRTLVVVGEQLLRPVAARAQEMFGPDCRILNLYGPTEATVGLTQHTFDATVDKSAAVPIGVPMPNCTVHLLDAQRRHVPPGEVGEMYLGGAQLACGYRARAGGPGQPDHGAFTRLADGSRVYRTGDLAVLNPAGELEFVGRADDQVKVMGHRVEPAEVAQVLQDHPAVRQAAVIARRGTLCAYVVAGADVDAQTLTGYLAERLPPYLVPTATTLVEAIPHTANGKVDAGALPDPFGGAVAAVADHGGRDEVDRAVAKVWAQTLGLDATALDERADFHQLGGNSLLLLSMLAGVCREVVGAEREREFMAGLGGIIREPTLSRVADLARQVR